MNSVRHWSAANNWRYEFLDDAFFALAPAWVRQRCVSNLYALTDICRLLWLQKQLEAGCERAIWVDADVLVFAPAQLIIAQRGGHAFAHELFLTAEDGRITAVEGLSNAVMVFTQGEPMLGKYLEACLSRLREPAVGPLARTVLGPQMLAALASENQLQSLSGIGLFTLAFMRQIAEGDAAPLRAYVQHLPTPPAAANLCHFLRNATAAHKRAEFDRIYQCAVDRLLDSGGAILR